MEDGRWKIENALSPSARGRLSATSCFFAKTPEERSAGGGHGQPRLGDSNPSSTIRYDLAHPGNVVVSIHDAAGRTVRTLWEAAQPPGTHTLRFERGGLAAGVYFCRVETEGGAEVAKVVVVGPE